MTLADDLNEISFDVRGFAGDMGLRPHTVEVVEGAWSGQHTGDGTETITSTPITEGGGHPPRVRWLSDTQIAMGGLPKGSIRVGPITPAFTNGAVTGGTALSRLLGQGLTVGETLNLLITGPRHPTGALYRVTQTQADSAQHYLITAEPVAEVIA